MSIFASNRKFNKMGIIYLIINLINGKKYVGQTRRTFKRRMIEHKRDSNRNRPGIDAAIAKYGWDNFKSEIIEICPVEKLNEREMFWIKKFNCKVPNGYNLTDGGDGGRSFSPTLATRAKISAKLKGRPAHNKGVPHSDKTKLKLSEIQKAIGNVPPYWKGKKRGSCPLKTRLKISKSLTGKHHSQDTRNKMTISQKERWAKKKAAQALENEKNIENKNE